MSKTISILGCGWLGVPLSHKLITEGYTVKGSVRNSESLATLSEVGISPYLLDVTPEVLSLNDPTFFDCDILIISIPPGRKDKNVHLFAEKAKIIRTAIDTNSIKKVIFISSTSVYPDTRGNVKEEDAIDPPKASGKTLLEAENILKANRSYDFTILRMAGLIGLNRNPLNFLARETECRNGNVPMNLVHLDDAVGAIHAVIENAIWNQTFNICSDEHPTRHEFYSLAAELTQQEAPKFNPKAEAVYKLVNSNKFITLSGYQFKYKNPLSYVREIYSNT